MAVEKRPDLILLDMNMPDMNGAQVLCHLKAIPQAVSIPVVIYSGRAGHDERISALRLGAEDYLEKPFDTEMLVRRIEHHLIKASETTTKGGSILADTPPSAPHAIKRREVSRTSCGVQCGGTAGQQFAAPTIDDELERRSRYMSRTSRSVPTLAPTMRQCPWPAEALLREDHGTIATVCPSHAAHPTASKLFRR